MNGVLKTTFNRVCIIKKQYKYMLLGCLLFVKNCFRQKQISAALYKYEYKKYNQCIKSDASKGMVYAQMQAFLTSSFSLIADNLNPSTDINEPTVFAVVRNELERMKVFFQHYRRLGVNQFVILDNGSDDGTLEFLSKQEGTKVYQVLDTFQTQKKEAWIEKLLVLNGLDRWCIVVDSDELLDYVGSEEHPIREMIKICNDLGYRRIWGYMLDMYAREPLFAHKGVKEPFTDYFRFFDKENYFLDSNRKWVYGGPRLRMFGSAVALSKQAMFFFEKELLYRNCHYLLPMIEWEEVPCWFVLRHYKFLPGDKKEYLRRIHEKSFYNNSSEYQTIMSQIEYNDVSLHNTDSQEYTDSYSLRGLPFLEEIQWQ